MDIQMYTLEYIQYHALCCTSQLTTAHHPKHLMWNPNKNYNYYNFPSFTTTNTNQNKTQNDFYLLAVVPQKWCMSPNTRISQQSFELSRIIWLVSRCLFNYLILAEDYYGRQCIDIGYCIFISCVSGRGNLALPKKRWTSWLLRSSKNVGSLAREILNPPMCGIFFSVGYAEQRYVDCHSLVF